MDNNVSNGKKSKIFLKYIIQAHLVGENKKKGEERRRNKYDEPEESKESAKAQYGVRYGISTESAKSRQKVSKESVRKEEESRRSQGSVSQEHYKGNTHEYCGQRRGRASRPCQHTCGRQMKISGKLSRELSTIDVIAT